MTYQTLYVDDEEGLLDVGKAFLEQMGSFTVDTITSAKEALNNGADLYFQKGEEPIDQLTELSD